MDNTTMPRDLVYKMIDEDEEYVKDVDYNLLKIHCDGCMRHCLLAKPSCFRGRSLKEYFEKGGK